VAGSTTGRSPIRLRRYSGSVEQRRLAWL